MKMLTPLPPGHTFPPLDDPDENEDEDEIDEELVIDEVDDEVDDDLDEAVEVMEAVVAQHQAPDPVVVVAAGGGQPVPLVPVAPLLSPIVWWPLSGVWVMVVGGEGGVASNIILGPTHPLPPHHSGP